MIYTCGPEVMVKKIFEMTEQRKLPIEASLERSNAVRHRLVRKLHDWQVPCLPGWPRSSMRRSCGKSKRSWEFRNLGFDGSRIPCLDAARLIWMLEALVKRVNRRSTTVRRASKSLPNSPISPHRCLSCSSLAASASGCGDLRSITVDGFADSNLKR